jgi:hypothetical protein
MINNCSSQLPFKKINKITMLFLKKKEKEKKNLQTEYDHDCLLNSTRIESLYHLQVAVTKFILSIPLNFHASHIVINFNLIFCLLVYAQFFFVIQF